ncbi:GL25806 [Drosophila persimilis]|uniref:GL25806 n=1 Tax=Drosophila persimilis TaxID=7234 RepID=B4GJT7_DROPE|nr:GL25806 [Drosophila persimilis]
MGILGGAELPVAPWHRGLSLAQIKAASDLQTELILDLEEATTHRVPDCLLRLGVCVQFDCCRLNKMIELSQGDNLAFLYFLYTMEYQSDCPHKKYTLNEQIVLSAIAYLDMPATIEALEKILPIPEKRLKTGPSKPNPNEKKCKENIKLGTKVLPYFEKQRRPKRKRKYFHSTPHAYEAGIPNESKDSEDPDYRWFADYEFHPSRRIVKSVISQEIVKLFDRIDEVRQGPEADRQNMCKYHQESRSLERESYVDRQRKQCLAMLDVDQERKLLTRQRIAKQLQRDVDRYIQKFGNNRWSPGVPAFRQIGCSACRLLGPAPLPVMVLDNAGEEYCKPWPKLDGSCDQMLRLSGGQDCRRPTKERTTTKGNYFQAPKLHAPYIFDYIGLFGRYDQMSLDAGKCIGGAVLKALQEDDGREIKEPIIVKRWHINDAVNQCVRRIYERSLAAFKFCPEPKERLSYKGKSHFDPDDEVFMDHMLSDAFKILKKNKKLVLATLYNGHQVPELREWIRRRYGKRYTVATRSELCDTWQKMRNLSEMHHELYTILMGHSKTREKHEISNAHYDLFLARAQKFQACFKDHVNEIVMERTRLCWRAMNYLRTKNYTGLQQTFFSYMPSTACAKAPLVTNTRTPHGRCGRSLGK